MKKIIFTITLLLTLYIAKGQNFDISADYPQITHPEPSVSSLMRFEEIPVSNYTGIPNVNVPFFTIPTRSKDIVLDLSIGYHPSSVAMDEVAGDCGLGWSLFSGGTISRTAVDRPDEYSGYEQVNKNDIYQFNFMGNTGRFYISKDAQGLLNLRIIENPGSKLVINLDYNQATSIINSFTIYDDSGYKYLFDVIDTQVYNSRIGTPLNIYKSGFHLSAVYDNNGKELISFSYDNYTQNTNNPSFSNNYKRAKEITVNGYGKVTYEYSTGTNLTYSLYTRLSQLLLKDVSNTVVKKIKFFYNGNNLIKVENCDNAETKKETYEFRYKTDISGNSLGTFVADEWGYSLYKPNCLFSYPIENVTENVGKKYCTNGVLYEMKTPTGGSIHFDYESNTFSYYNLDTNGQWVLVNTPENYYDEQHLENYTVNSALYHEFTGNGQNTVTFTVPGTGTTPIEYYVNVDPTLYTIANIDTAIYSSYLEPNQTEFYPSFVLTGQGYNYQPLALYKTTNNFCMGELVYLIPGQTYTFSIGAFGDSNKKGTLHLTKRENKPNPSMINYGGGLRIKRISYFDKNITDYYQNTEYYNSSGVYPSKEKLYSYNLFDLPNRSSGVIVYPDFDADTNSRVKREPVGYKNVTVYETGNGREEYTYTTPFDFGQVGTSQNALNVVYYDYKRGLLTKKRTYSSTNALLNEFEFAYDYVETPNSTVFFDNPALNERLGWSKLTQKISRLYFPNSTDPVTVTENYIYDDTIRKVITHTQSNSLGETLKTQTTYHVGNSSFSQNRIAEIEKIETFRGTELLFTQKNNYGNAWYNNSSYLPNVMSNSKGTQALENRFRYNMYDEYSNPTEIQKENGTITTILWGYNKTLPIAKIENASNAQVASALGTSNVNLMNESNLLAINNLRSNASLSGAMITTYTYIPLIGISTVTDPKGDKLIYEYDVLNRLKTVRDKNNNILNENQYYSALNNDELNWALSTNYKVATTTSVTSPNVAVANVYKTFFDGLGRPVQEIASQQSNTGKDIVNHIEYDMFGRRAKSYLPFVNSGSSLNFNTNAKDQTLNYPDYVGQFPFVENIFEQSPLNRVIEKASPGVDWNANNTDKHTIRMEYLTNTTSDAVRNFKAVASGTTLSTNGYYDEQLIDGGIFTANQLFKSVMRNENWKPTDGDNNTTITFTDKEGRQLLKRTYAVSVVNGVETYLAHDSYNVYDQYGNVAFIISPKADGAITSTVLTELCYQYRYDYRNRLVEKKLPGKQWEFVLYDKLDRIVGTGPALSPFSDATANTYGWMITKYDAFDRNILTAWMSGTATSAGRKTLQDSYNSTLLPLNESKSASNTTINYVAFRYTSAALPTSGYDVLTVNYFDNYSYTGAPTAFTTVMNDNSQSVYYNTTILPKGLLTGSWVRIIEASTTVPVRADVNYALYDYKARVIRARTDNYLTGYTQVDFKLDFAGKILYTETKHKRISTNTEIYTRDDYAYSNQDRLLTHIHKIGLTGTPQLLAKNEYDELGKLKAKRVGGTDVTTFSGLQKVDYSYNIRGWLTEINKVNNLSQGSDVRDLFAFKINYNTVDNNLNNTVNAQYNGNISEVYWRTDSDNVLRKYGFEYDNLNRLKKATYQKPNSAVPVTNSYNEMMKYDKNGNITSLQRFGDFDDAMTALQIDNLSYSYLSNSNQLKKVTDATNNTVGFNDDSDGTNDTVDDYSYDANGNMLTDQNKGILNIKYNHLNLPIEITFTGTNKKINYIYNGAGVKVKKTVTNASAINHTDYISGFQYAQTGTGTVVLQFFPHTEGYVSNTVVGGVNNYNYVFNYTDHLGNVRLSYTKDPGTNVLKILEESHYYPYGLKHAKYNIDQAFYDQCAETGQSTCIQRTSRLPYQYKFNSQEYQDEMSLNMTAMDFRQYDNAIGRFVGIDLLSELNTTINPYHFANNNPIFWADPSGLDPVEQLNSGVPWLDEMWNHTENGTNSHWSNIGGSNFQCISTSGGGGSGSGLTGAWVSFEGVFNPPILNSSGTMYWSPGYVIRNGNISAGKLDEVGVGRWKKIKKGGSGPSWFDLGNGALGTYLTALDNYATANAGKIYKYGSSGISNVALTEANALRMLGIAKRAQILGNTIGIGTGLYSLYKAEKQRRETGEIDVKGYLDGSMGVIGGVAGTIVTFGLIANPVGLAIAGTVATITAIYSIGSFVYDVYQANKD
ncbi:MAG: hypothetical protein JNJ52_09965 [Flavobacterium sp.]|nr:hypothetical protein [Flavobacterium sp.]